MCCQPRETAARITGKGGKRITGVGGNPLVICCSNTGNKERFVDKLSTADGGNSFELSIWL